MKIVILCLACLFIGLIMGELLLHPFRKTKNLDKVEQYTMKLHKANGKQLEKQLKEQKKQLKQLNKEIKHQLK